MPEDSCGTPHIIEHSVLCGSKNYPLKDPFIVLAQGSLQTYLNAWTFPDRTLYPASSKNRTDYFNLFSVYGDAVFRANLDRWTFEQEGIRFTVPQEAAKKAAPALGITGVVYNEMKGVYSSADEYESRYAISSVLPDTYYIHDSGGDTDCIPHLSYEKFIDYYRRHYSPACCKVFLYGNIPTVEQLAFLNDNFLSDSASGNGGIGDRGGVSPQLRNNARQQRWNEKKRAPR